MLNLLTTFAGRINRRQWWTGFIVVLLGSIFGTLLFNPETFTTEGLPPLSWPDTLWQLAWIVPGMAIAVKRFNDRDRPRWLGYAYGVLGAFLIVAPHLGLSIIPDGGPVAATIFWISVAAILGAVVDNGFLPGTRGANRYGPDPLA
ncbi:MAG TPA: DUF805 domain-containing protein [Hyphomicrobium sp.]|nr:DUF805 domain-containing protein [Hyphomicrobium sp.]